MLRTTVVYLAAATAAWAAKPAIPKASVPATEAFRNRLAGAAGASDEWWKGFDDPLLDRLIERAGRNNLEVRKAAARVVEAEASRRGSRSALLPEVGASASGSELRGGFSQG